MEYFPLSERKGRLKAVVHKNRPWSVNYCLCGMSEISNICQLETAGHTRGEIEHLLVGYYYFVSVQL